MNNDPSLGAPSAHRTLANQSPSNWGKWLLAKNPFYLASAGLLLYGVDKFTSIVALASPSAEQWMFHLGALFVYELMLVVTAIFLARRSIWYDAILLVVLENVFILVPFSVVSRLVLANSSLAKIVTFTWVFFVAVKFWALRRYIHQLRLPRRFLIFGNLFALVNAVWPLLFHSLENERERLHHWLIVSWLLILPLLAGAAFLLPKPDFSRTAPAQQWKLFPTLFGLWLMVTACHLGGLGYVHTFNWETALLAPTVLVIAWALHFRLGDFYRNAPKTLQHCTLCIPAAAILLSIAQDDLFRVLRFRTRQFMRCSIFDNEMRCDFIFSSSQLRRFLPHCLHLLSNRRDWI